MLPHPTPGRTVRGALRSHAARYVAPASLAVVAVSATVAVVLTGSAAAPEAQPVLRPAFSASMSSSDVVLARAADREQALSRSAARPARSARRVSLRPHVTGHRWSTDHLNVWPAPREQGRRLRVLDPGTRLAVTGRVVGHWAEAVMNGRARWVNADYLSKDKPAGGAAGGLSSAACPDGSAVESGITSTAVRLYRAACAAFPALTTYGGYDPHGEHADGRAIDFMTGDPALGNALAEWARANAPALGIRTVIWSQRIWTPERAGEGWRGMSDRGSATANHYDHVHVSVY